MGVIVIGLGISQSTGVNFGCTWKHQGALVTSLGAPTTSLGAPRITVEQSGKNIFIGNAAGAPGIHSTTYCSTIFKTHVLSVYSNLCIYRATHLYTVCLDWLQAVRESNSKGA